MAMFSKGCHTAINIGIKAPCGRIRHRVVIFITSALPYDSALRLIYTAMRGRRIAHEGDPLLEWYVGNVVGRYQARSNVNPRKAGPEQKIDAALALIMRSPAAWPPIRRRRYTKLAGTVSPRRSTNPVCGNAAYQRPSACR